MMNLLEITGLTHSFGDKLLYRGASLTLLKGEHMGVVGPNGAGKSTLIQILTGEQVPDEGQIRWQPGVRLGYLNQYASVDGACPVHACLQAAFKELYAIEREMQALYEKGALPGGEAALLQAGDYQQELEAKGFYQIDSETARLEQGLGLTAFGLDTPLGCLSGGQRAKVLLAKLLLERADVLLLDEPTNFLDKAHVDWLSGYLAGFPGAFVVVSHDSSFLERVCASICDIESGTVRKYHGKYSAYLRQKEFLRADYVRQYHTQQREIEKTEAYIRKNKAGVNAKMARGRQKQLDRLERLAPPAFAAKPEFRFQTLPLLSQNALVIKRLLVGYDRPLLPRLDLTVASGQTLVITGFNGIGKSTLLKTLVGELPPLGGSYCFAQAARVGYYAQDLNWEHGEQTPLQILRSAVPARTDKQLLSHLARCGVKSGNVRQAVNTLSGGEQSRVKLARLLLSPVNFLVLDEPTNHLDAGTKQALGDALRRFDGSVLIVSHEEEFYRDWADTVVSVGAYGLKGGQSYG